MMPNVTGDFNLLVSPGASALVENKNAGCRRGGSFSFFHSAPHHHKEQFLPEKLTTGPLH